MESHYKIAPRNRFKVAILASYFTAIFLFVFPAEAFYLSVRQQGSVTSSLFSQEENQDAQDSQTGKDAQTSEPSLRRYQGGMIRPVVIAAKPEPTSNFMKVNGQDTSLSRRDGTESSRMFRPTVVRTNDDENVNSPQPLTVDESTIYTTCITGGMIGAQTGIGDIAEKEEENKAETQTEAAPNKALKETKVEAAVEMDPLVEMEPSDAEAAEMETTAEKLEESRDIEQNLGSSEERITEEEEPREKEAEETREEETEMEKQPQEDQTSKSNNSTNTHKAVENKVAETTEPILDESKTNENSETEEVKPTNLDVSALEQEDEKLEAIHAKIQLRKQQQVELEKMEADLLRKTEEIMRRKEELLRLEEEFVLAEKASKNDDKTSGEIPEKEREEEIPYYSPKEYSALSPEQKAKLREARAAMRKTDNSPSDDANGNDLIHPILGPAVVDLGYKRVHVVSSGRLGTIPVWKKQRTYRYDRVQRMAAEKGKQMHLGFPGIICLYEDTEGKLSIVDGQHRVGMMQALRESRKKFKQGEVGEEPDETWNEQEKYFQNILVEVYSEASTGYATQASNKDIDYAKQVFQEINKAQPIALIDGQDFASETERKIISEAVSILKDLYGDMFISSRRCRPPNANVDNLRNSILGSKVLKRHKELTTGKELADWLVTQNSVVGELYEMDSERQQLIEPNAWLKASNNGFYLGLESSWLYK